MSEPKTIEISDPSSLPEHPLVSVYTLAYRHEAYIADAIEGVVTQQCDFPIELIIGEDCSPDRTLEIALDYQRRYPHLVRVLTSDRNIGARANADRCRAACRGTFVAPCEGDDYWHYPRKLQMQVEALSRNPAATLVHTDYDRRIGDRILHDWNRRIQRPHLAQGDAFEALLRRMSVATATSMHKRSVLADYAAAGIDDSHWPFGDYPRVLYASLQGPVIYLPVSTATYRYAPGSVMNQGARKLMELFRATLDCREQFMKLRPCSPAVQREVRSISRRAIMQQALLLGDRDAYVEEYRQLSSLNNAPDSLEYLAAMALTGFPPLLKTYLVLLRRWQRFKFFVRSRRVNENRQA